MINYNIFDYKMYIFHFSIPYMDRQSFSTYCFQFCFQSIDQQIADVFENDEIQDNFDVNDNVQSADEDSVGVRLRNSDILDENDDHVTSFTRKHKIWKI